MENGCGPRSSTAKSCRRSTGRPSGSTLARSTALSTISRPASDTINPRSGHIRKTIVSSRNTTISVCYLNRTRRTRNLGYMGRYPIKRNMIGVTIPLGKFPRGESLRIVSIVSIYIMDHALNSANVMVDVETQAVTVRLNSCESHVRRLNRYENSARYRPRCFSLTPW
jgi:hypothetical protein